MIIDSHEHLGDCYVYDHSVSEEGLLGALNKNGVDGALVFPFPGAADAPAVHNDIAALAKKYPGRIYGVVSLNPHRSPDEFDREVKRCVDMGFKGIKIHPFGHACPLGARDAQKVFVAARTYGIPVIVHTGLGVPYTLPSVVMQPARQYPEVTFVIAHAGAYIYSAEALLVAQECPNVYLETSWCSAHRIREFVEKLGPERVMFGSDIPINIESELAKYRSMLPDETLKCCFAETAQRVFKLPS